MSESWPPSLKDWVAKCLGQMTDANRDDAQTELRGLIQEAYTAKTLWTTDWAGIQLQSLEPKLTSLLMQPSLKRKAETAANKKNKKITLAKQVALNVPSADQVAKEKRARRFEREHELERTRLPGFDSTPSQSPSPAPSPYVPPFARSSLASRLQRGSFMGGGTLDVTPDANVLDWDKHTIVGRSQEMFKDYLRLTESPNPDTIRPLTVLRKTLAELKNKWKTRTDQNYNWICSQFKSLRQDLTVQRIQNTFTVEVYEIHARMAIEAGDLVEFNQCLSALKTLYLRGIDGRKDEFTAYRILYMLHARQRSDLNRLIGELTAKQKAVPEIRHALLVSTAVSTNNYHSLFQLYLESLNMGAYIMDFLVPRGRILALTVMCKAYKTVPLKFISLELAFDSIDEAHEFLVSHGAAFYTNPNVLNSEKLFDAKSAAQAISTAYNEKYSKVSIKGSI